MGKKNKILKSGTRTVILKIRLNNIDIHIGVNLHNVISMTWSSLGDLAHINLAHLLPLLTSSLLQNAYHAAPCVIS